MKKVLLLVGLLGIGVVSAKVNLTATSQYGDDTREFKGDVVSDGDESNVVRLDHGDGVEIACSVEKEGEKSVSVRVKVFTQSCNNPPTVERRVELPWGEPKTLTCLHAGTKASLTLQATRVTA